MAGGGYCSLAEQASGPQPARNACLPGTRLRRCSRNALFMLDLAASHHRTSVPLPAQPSHSRAWSTVPRHFRTHSQPAQERSQRRGCSSPMAHGAMDADALYFNRGYYNSGYGGAKCSVLLSDDSVLSPHSADAGSCRQGSYPSTLSKGALLALPLPDDGSTRSPSRCSGSRASSVSACDRRSAYDTDTPWRNCPQLHRLGETTLRCSR